MRPVYIESLAIGERKRPEWYSGRLRSRLAWLLLIAAFSSPAARAQESESAGRFVSVAPAVNGEGVNRILQTVEVEYRRFQAVNNQRPDAQRRVFRAVFDFNPDGKNNYNDNYGYCLNLADGIRKLQKDGVRTAAFVHGDVTGHAVLAALACEQIYMSPRGRIGPVIRDDTTPLDESKRRHYAEVGERLGAVLIAKLFDRNLTVWEGQRGGFVTNEAEAAWKDAAMRERKPPKLPAGQVAVFDFKKATEVNIAFKTPFDSREELAGQLQMPPDSMRESPLLERIVAWKIPVTGEVNRKLDEQVRRRVRRAMGKGANFLILELQCNGGDTAIANELGEYLLGLSKNEDKPVVSVAYCTQRSDNTALYLALGCNYIVLEKGATLGGFQRMLKGKGPRELESIGEGIERLAEKQYYPPTLVRAFVDTNVGNIFRVTSATGSSRWAVLSGKQLDDEENRKKWNKDAEPIPLDSSGFLTLDTEQAKKFGLAHAVVNDINELYDQFGLKASQVREAGADWLDDLAEFLQNEWTGFILVLIGITCLIIELKLPGIGVPGVIAALCFVLYFWAHSGNGQVTWLAILLFLLGLLLLGIEIFVLPGFGVCGISGIVLVLGSLALVAVGHWPQDSSEWVGLSKKMAPFGLSLMAAVVLAILVVRYLPSLPFASRLILKPPTETAEGEAAAEHQSPYANMLGAIGVASTPLRPAGKVKFGDEYVDVVAEGSYIGPGGRVQVIEVEGNRIVVKAV